jgi:hypothetical protein
LQVVDGVVLQVEQYDSEACAHDSTSADMTTCSAFADVVVRAVVAVVLQVKRYASEANIKLLEPHFADATVLPCHCCSCPAGGMTRSLPRVLTKPATCADVVTCAVIAVVQVKRYESEADKKLLETPDINKYVFCQVLADCGQVRATTTAPCGGLCGGGGKAGWPAPATAAQQIHRCWVGVLGWFEHL